MSPEAWARCFEGLYRDSNADQRARLRDYNAAAIEDASHSLGAEVVFTDLFAMDADTAASGAAAGPGEAPGGGLPGAHGPRGGTALFSRALKTRPLFH